MALPLQGEVVDEWWTDLLPGDYLGVDFADDEVSHERLALLPLSGRNGTCVVRSPDGDEWSEDPPHVDPSFGPSRAWLFPRVGLRPRGRRRLYAFRARLVDEPPRAAILWAREQAVQMGGDGAYRTVQVVRSAGTVRTLQEFIPDMLREVAPGYVMETGWLQDLERVGMLLRLVPVFPLVMRLSSYMGMWQSMVMQHSLRVEAIC